MERRLRHLFTSIFCLGILWTLFVLWPGQAGHFVRRSSASAPALQEPDAASTATVSLVPTKTSHVSKRAASTWPQAVETGAGLMCKLKQKDRNGNYASDWTALSELQQYWTDTGYEGGGSATTTGQTIGEALAELGLPSRRGEAGLAAFRDEQDKEWTEGGKVQRETNAEYQNIMSTVAGFISAEQNFGPEYMSEKYDKPRRAPPLKKLSDVLFIKWQSLGGDIQNLKYFIRLHIKNDMTRGRIKDAVGEVVPRWPGVTYEMTEEKGQALLGTPNGIGVAYFLIQHKPQLGIRALTKVTVWSTPSPIEGEEDYFHMLFYIRKVKKPTN